jgi:hypothetical protein
MGIEIYSTYRGRIREIILEDDKIDGTEKQRMKIERVGKKIEDTENGLFFPPSSTPTPKPCRF